MSASPGLDLVYAKQDQIFKLCEQNQVARLELFGSATSDRFNPKTSDFDFLVEFTAKSYHGAADRYFGLLYGLVDLLERAVDLVELEAVKNPYFLEAIAPTRVIVYGR